MRTMKNSIKEFRHSVVLCSSKDVIESEEDVSITKTEVVKRWAKIETRKPFSKWNTYGYSEDNDANEPTHRIVFYMDRTMDISSTAWVYEKRLQSGDRWYRVVSIKELDEGSLYTVMNCVLKQRGDTLAPIVKKPDVCLAAELPSGVRL